MDRQVLSVTQELLEVSRLLEDDDVTSVLDRLVARATATVPGCDHVTVTVGDERGRLETVAGQDLGVLAHSLVDEPTWSSPVFDVVRYREPRRVDDIDSEQRWPGFRDRMQKAGFRSCLGLPLPAQRRPTVAFTLYSAQPDQFTAHSLDLVLLFTLHAGAVFDNAETYGDCRKMVENLHTALVTRGTIGQAQGLLMHRFGWDGDTALADLRRVSQHRQIKLRQLSEEMVLAQEKDDLDDFLGRMFGRGDERPAVEA